MTFSSFIYKKYSRLMSSRNILKINYIFHKIFGDHKLGNLGLDFSDKPIEELSKAFKEYKKMHDYYLARALEPSKIPSQDDWVKKLKSINKDK